MKLLFYKGNIQLLLHLEYIVHSDAFAYPTCYIIIKHVVYYRINQKRSPDVSRFPTRPSIGFGGLIASPCLFFLELPAARSFLSV